MGHPHLLALTLTCTACAGIASPVAAEHRDPQALAVSERLVAAMGGRRQLEAARVVRFDFAVVRDGETVARYAHWWDRHAGAYRLDGRDREGVGFRVLLDLETREGEAWRGGERLQGEPAAELLDTAYRRFINDSYWLLMPWKWLDEGVDLAYRGTRELDGDTFDVVELTFAAGVGLTSADRYWALVSRRSGHMERWEYLLQQADGSPGEGEPTAWAWEDWRDAGGGIALARVRRRLGDGPRVTIEFPVAELYHQVTAAQLEAMLRPDPATPVPLP
jgi:hypothetical protein